MPTKTRKCFLLYTNVQLSHDDQGLHLFNQKYGKNSSTVKYYYSFLFEYIFKCNLFL